MFSADPSRYDGRMPYRRCGKSGLLLPEISLGCWHNFGHFDDQHEARAILRRAFDRGITHFDLANNYGPPYGSAEENVGRFLAEDFACHRDELVISSKAGHDMWQGPYGEWGSRKHLLSSLDQSLRRLRLDYVDIFYSHRPDPKTPLEETMSALATAVQQGKALYVGLSKYPLKRLKRAVSILKDMGVRCLIYQPPYSILNRWPETEGIHEWLHDKGIGSIVFSPLAQGMLTGKYLAGIPEGSRAAREEGFLQTDQVAQQHDKLHALHAVATEAGMPLHHLALRWALQQRGVTSALIGARTVAQLDDSLDALHTPEISADLLARINEISPA
ncbi:L-glyceraldehyde 3-phosphate reductase [Haloferula luteola]|uniref:L-glyceraldehyde 3-phosphate reductase n=1 Tax=Haloferula luteola TaxID=595692 RepID=A0A840V433_9BACT|nr:aldo/keto reductase [Haloferula luteola]MBB5352293.1 L-glyceraldehyde 3-phosphate reductase [Haloferula luteola]